MALIELKDISKVYPKGHKALDGINLTFEAGEVVGLLGVNGSGKTTCSTILAGLHPPTSGQLFCKGELANANMPKYRQHVGYCPQKPTLHDNLSVYDNLYYGGLYFGLTDQMARNKVEALIDQFELLEHKDFMPDALSGGYQQRVMLARALIHDPDFIILDEPTVGLDPSIRKKLWDIIDSLKKQGKSILLTTHYLDEADVLCDRVCILDHGKILRIATKAELKNEHQQKDLEEIFLKLTEEEVS